MKFLALSLVLALLLPCAVAENAGQQYEPDLLEEFLERDTIPSLFRAAEDALKDGTDPAKVRDALYTAADMKDMYPFFSYAVENYVAMGGKGYNKLIDVFGGDDNYYRSVGADWETSRSANEDISFDAYSDSEASSQFKSMIGDKGAQCCITSYFLAESDFKTLYKKDFSNFVPSRPRPGYISVVVKNEAQSWPKKTWQNNSDSDDYEDFHKCIRDLFSSIYSSLNEDRSKTPLPVITGNPNLASSFLVYNVTYAPDNKSYTINDSVRVKGYKTTVSISLQDAITKKELAKYSETIVIDTDDEDMYYKWNDGIVIRTDLPDFSSRQSFRTFIKSLASEIRKQDNLTSASRPLTESNSKAVLDGILQAQANGAGVWETAIYESGAEEITLNGSSEVSFSLRSYDPKLKKLGSYNKAEDRNEWLDTALLRISKHNLKITLELSNGVPTKQSLSRLKATVGKAAKTARKAFVSSDMTAALKDRLFPSPLKEEASKYTKLFQPTDSFSGFYDKYLSDNDHLSLSLFSMICYAQKNLSVNVKKGPHNLLLTFTGIAKPASFVKSSANKVVKTMAFLPFESRPADEEPEYTLLKRIARSALSSHTDAKDTFTLTIDVDQLITDTLPSGYVSYLNEFDISAAVDSMTERINSLPQIAAVEMPNTKILTGGKTGKAQMALTLSADSNATYVQLRKRDTKEKVATFFVHPGNKITVKAPGGEYYIVYCSGTFWYGEKKRFMKPDSIFYSEPFNLKNNYLQSYELNVIDGNIGTHPGSPDDLDD